MITRDDIIELFPDEEFLFADDFDTAIIGVDDRDHRVIYSLKEVIHILMDEGMTEDDARDYYEYNVLGSWVGEKTPIYLNDDFYRSCITDTLQAIEEKNKPN